MSALAEERAALRRLAAGGEAAADVTPLIRRDTHVLLAVIWAAALAATLLSAWMLLAHASAHARQTAVSLEQYARRNITLAAFVVDEFAQYLDQRGSLAGISSDAAARDKLRSLVKWLPPDSGAALFFADGNLALAADPTVPANLNVSDRNWFKVTAGEGRLNYVGPAILSRVTRRFVYTYTAAYRDADGKLLGVVSLAIPCDAITGLLTPDQHGTALAIVQHEGPVVAAQPFTPDLLDAAFPLPQPVPDSDRTFLGEMMGHYSLGAIRNVPDLGLYAVTALPLVTVLTPLLWGVATGFTLLLVLSAMLLRQSQLLQQKSGEVEQALADNKVLFQEVHHRVKNNLQVVSSLLRLQTERLPPELRPVLEETGARVRAIALVHEQIYRTASPSVVQLDRFLAELVQQLQASMIGRTAVVSTDLAPVRIGLDLAVPVAMLATEAITNAIKHGLGGGDGQIAVVLKSAGGRNVLEVRDSGNGPPADSQAGLGTRIMTALARQIDGQWAINPRPGGGTVFTLSWPD